MKINIANYYGGAPNVPGLQWDIASGGYFIEVEPEKLMEFVQSVGRNVVLSPPGQTPHKDGWFIWLSDHTGKFTQK